MGDTHFIEIPCKCDYIEWCVTERYIADIRTAIAEIARLREKVGEVDQCPNNSTP